jgi:formylglycine-generating enzyme required for sulfatase activity/tRNA A-37 threonylcarbamoyl transferase component Bud32
MAEQPSSQAETLTRLRYDMAALRAHAEREPLERWTLLVRKDHEARWLRGEHVPVEAYLEALPQLQDHLSEVMELIYQEVVLRVRAGRAPTLEEYQGRFPVYSAALEALYAEEQAAARNEQVAAPPPAAMGDPPTLTRVPPKTPQPGALGEPPTLTHGPPKTPQPPTTPAPPKPEPAAAAQESPPGLGDYEVLEELGHGGMGVVYKARHRVLHRLVALKMILPGGAGRDDITRFLREAEAVAELEHPHIVQIHEIGRHLGQPYFALEYLGGGTLDRKLRDSALPPDEAARLLVPVARAIHFAHSHGIVHRDLKPANILLSADGVPKVGDFGLAKRVADDSGLTQTGAILGTPSYMAPEQARGSSPGIGPAADIYGLGAVLYELLTGRPPFKAACPMDTLFQVLGEEPMPPRQLQPKLPRDLETICLKCLRKSPANRYATALEVAEDLERFLADEPIKARPPSALQRLRRWARRHRAALQVAAAVVLTLVTLGWATRWWLARQAEQEMASELRQGQEELQQADAAGPEADAARGYDAALRHFAAARMAAPESDAVKEALVDLYLHRCRRALSRQEYAVARGILILLKNLDGVEARADEIAECQRQALGTGTWALQTDPPGAAVTLARIDAEGRSSKPVPSGTTPIEPREIAPGSYILSLHHPQYADVRYPFFIGHNAAEALKVPLVKSADVPEGMVYIPAGEFLFGDPQAGTQRRVHLDGYFIDRTEVTGAAYEKFVQATGGRPPDRWEGLTCPLRCREEAVCNVSWFEALEYCRWAGKELPTEMEWEKAARGADGRSFPWGNRYEPHRSVCRDSLQEKSSLGIGRRPAGASPYGCLDMAGNVWEWTVDRETPARTDRVIRGGAAYSNADELLCFRRKGAPPGGSSYGGLNLLGFRCIKRLHPGPPLKSILDALAGGHDLADAAGFYWDQGRLDQVQACADRLLQRNPRSVPGNYWQAVLLDRAGRGVDAIGPLQRVLGQRTRFAPTTRTPVPIPEGLLVKLTVSNPSAAAALELPRLFVEVQAAAAAKKDAETEPLCQKILALDPDNEIAHEEMEILCRRANRISEANRHRDRLLAAYQAQLAENPDNAETLDLLADYLCLKNLQLARALKLAEQAVKQEPNVARYHKTLADVCAATGKYQDAIREITRAMELDPEEKDYRDRLSRYQKAARQAAGPHS